MISEIKNILDEPIDCTILEKKYFIYKEKKFRICSSWIELPIHRKHEILKTLEVSENNLIKLLTSLYGYLPVTSTTWPEFKEDDEQAIRRIINYITKTSSEQKSKFINFVIGKVELDTIDKLEEVLNNKVNYSKDFSLDNYRFKLGHRCCLISKNIANTEYINWVEAHDEKLVHEVLEVKGRKETINLLRYLYGYEPASGAWPEYKENDTLTQLRVFNYLNLSKEDKIKAQNLIFPVDYNITSPVINNIKTLAQLSDYLNQPVSWNFNKKFKIGDHFYRIDSNFLAFLDDYGHCSPKSHTKSLVNERLLTEDRQETIDLLRYIYGYSPREGDVFPEFRTNDYNAGYRLFNYIKLDPRSKLIVIKLLKSEGIIKKPEDTKALVSNATSKISMPIVSDIDITDRLDELNAYSRSKTSELEAIIDSLKKDIACLKIELINLKKEPKTMDKPIVKGYLGI